MVAQGIRYHYKALTAQELDLPISGRDYLEKIVQIPIFVPSLRPETVAPFLRERLSWLADDESREQIINIFHHGLPRNPRVCKRAMNMLEVINRLAREIDQGTARPLSRPLLAKLVVLRYRYVALYDFIARNPSHLTDLEKKARGEGDAKLGDFATYIQPNNKADSSATIRDLAPELAEMLKQEPYFAQRQGEVEHLIFLTSMLRSETA